MTSPIKRIDGVTLSDKRVLMRADLNLPVQDGLVSDWTRLERCTPTIRHIIDRGGQVVLLSHFGRPAGQYDPQLSFKELLPQIRDKLALSCELLDHRGELPLASLNAQQEIADVLLVDNTRFFSGETTGDQTLSRAIAELGDCFCLDAFSVSHRNHTTVTGLASFLPSFAGFSLADELDALNATLATIGRPCVAIVGGAKVSTKIDVLRNLIPKTDTLIVGGGMANTFLKAIGYEIGSSLVEDDQLSTAREIMQFADSFDCALVLPTDVATHHTFASTDKALVCDIKDVGESAMILDFGPTSMASIKGIVSSAKTLLWNGPLGAFEIIPFEIASVEVAKFVANRCASGELKAVAGGGDTLALLAKAGVSDDFTFCSTGGGAFLEWLEGKKLPGLSILSTVS
ncbi:phosphoglycerate kinase [Ruegeria sp. MALMAid1280]|uniref:phosphoglycerate kinase n=1 Tax=Ruegeria sp. MALMAid1280 TaxID=3411634 RepID=UPI003BA35CAA